MSPRPSLNIYPEPFTIRLSTQPGKACLLPSRCPKTARLRRPWTRSTWPDRPSSPHLSPSTTRRPPPLPGAFAEDCLGLATLLMFQTGFAPLQCQRT